jgi:hypothetical protein
MRFYSIGTNPHFAPTIDGWRTGFLLRRFWTRRKKGSIINTMQYKATNRGNSLSESRYALNLQDSGE